MIKLKANKESLTRHDLCVFPHRFYIQKIIIQRHKIWKYVFILYYKAHTISDTEIFLIGKLERNEK